MKENKSIPTRPTSDPKKQLADKTKAMTTGSVVQKDGFSSLEGNNIDPVIRHKPLPK